MFMLFLRVIVADKYLCQTAVAGKECL